MRLWAILFSFLFVSMAGAQTPAITDGGIINGASFAKGQAVSPGSIVAIFGTELASNLQQASSVPLSTTLADTSVTVNNVPAPLYFVSAGQINAQVPWSSLPQGSNTGSANVVVRRGSNSSAGQTVQLTSVAPGIFTIVSGASLLAVVYDATTGILAQPPGSVPGLTTEPTQAGKILSILATGLGPVNPPVQDGKDSLDALRTAVTTPTVLIGGKPITPAFAGLAPQFPGVYQINIVVPDGLPTGNAVPLQLQVGAFVSTDAAVMALK
jgi:uncharacterized protein (TIGR03437 family)